MLRGNSKRLPLDTLSFVGLNDPPAELLLRHLSPVAFHSPLVSPLWNAPRVRLAADLCQSPLSGTKFEDRVIRGNYETSRRNQRPVTSVIAAVLRYRGAHPRQICGRDGNAVGPTLQQCHVCVALCQPPTEEPRRFRRSIAGPRGKERDCSPDRGITIGSSECRGKIGGKSGGKDAETDGG